MNIGALIQATRNAKARTGRKDLSTAAKAGKIQICEVTMNAKGKSTVTPITGFLPMAEAIAYLESMQ